MYMKIVVLGTLLAASNALLAQNFVASSPDIANGQAIPQKFAFKGFGCTGNNISPSITWNNPPVGTKSFAVTVHDPDAQTGGAGFWHWVVINVPASARSIEQGTGNASSHSLPEGAQQIATDFGTPGWGGPCPPTNEPAHRYNFTVYALKVDKLSLPGNATASFAGFMINMNAIGKASFSAQYGR